MILLHPGGEPNFGQWASDFVEKTYSQWSDNDDITIWKAYDTVVLRMRSASLIAGFAADTNNWRYAVVLLARYFLVFFTDTISLCMPLIFYV